MGQVGQPVGVQGLAQAATEWYGRDRRYGMGRRECKYLPLHIQARAGIFMWPCPLFMTHCYRGPNALPRHY